jgi:hypothetical protein
MKTTQTLVFLAGLALGALTATTLGAAHADPQPAFDRQLTERIMRAEEAQAEAQRQQVQQLRELTQVVRDAGRR